MTTHYRCACTTASPLSCAGDTTFDDPGPDGACPCVCHDEYQDDPENWQPLTIDPSGDEVPGMIDLEARLDAAEALTGENDV